MAAEIESLENELSRIRDSAEKERRQLEAVFQTAETEQTDLCRKINPDHPLSGPVNSLFSGFESLFRHLTGNMIQVINGEKELSFSVKTLNKEVKVQEKNSGRILSETENFSESLEMLLNHTSSTAEIAEKAAESAVSGTRELDGLLTHIDSIGTNMDRTWREMEELREVSSSINELTAAINDTAEQLHLISVNTSIEASKMANKSFQVIAREIQKMASGTSETVSRVDTMVNDIRSRIRNVDEALASSQESTRVCLSKSGQVKQAFSSINSMNNRLKTDTNAIREELARGKDGVESISESSRQISYSASGIRREADKASDLSETLLKIVNSVIREIGVYRLYWHKQIQEQCEEGALNFKNLTHFDQSSMDLFLKNFLNKYPAFELVYILDDQGLQVSSNVRRNESGEIQLREGFGVNRADKEYFTRVMERNKTYLTGIYLSSATEDLCITVSVPAVQKHDKYVIAADVSLKGLIG